MTEVLMQRNKVPEGATRIVYTTGKLRWVRHGSVLTLQQEFYDQTMLKQEWRDVPMVDEQ